MAYDDARELLNSLESELSQGLAEVEERLVRERDFLQRIRATMTDSISITARTHELSKAQTIGFIDDYLPYLRTSE